MKTYTDLDLLGILHTRIAGCSQKQIAGDLGFTPQFINDVVAGRRMITPKLAAALGYTKLQNRYFKAKQQKEQ